MSYRTPIEQLADEVRHLTAQIPREASVVRNTGASRAPRTVNPRISAAIRQAWAEKGDPALQAQREQRLRAMEALVPQLSGGFALVHLRNTNLRGDGITAARTRVVRGLAERGYSQRDICKVLQLSAATVGWRMPQ